MRSRPRNAIHAAIQTLLHFLRCDLSSGEESSARAARATHCMLMPGLVQVWLAGDNKDKVSAMARRGQIKP
jgi:hypothetical protein